MFASEEMQQTNVKKSMTEYRVRIYVYIKCVYLGRCTPRNQTGVAWCREIGLRLHQLQAPSKRDVIGHLLIIQSCVCQSALCSVRCEARRQFFN